MLLQKLNRYAVPLGFLLYFVGVIWFFLLSQDELSYATYLSENALLVGVVDETFKSDSAMFELNEKFANTSSGTLTLPDVLCHELQGAGLEVYEQEFTYSHKLLVGEVVSGKNVYAIMRSRSGSRTEALVVMAPLRVPTSSDSVATSYTFITTVAKHIRSQLYWAKDLIFLFADMDYIGLLAWLDAYHGVRTTKSVVGAELMGRAGSIQAGINIEFPSLLMDGIDISYQGVNGELPNLDIINTLKLLASKLRVPVSLHGQIHWNYGQDRLLRLQQLTSSVWVQGSGSPSGLHGVLINFQIPTVTLRGIPSVRDSRPSLRALEMVGSLLEAFLRCLNNLQERFHQSFYYYLLPGLGRYISIGVFTPPFFVAMAGLVLLVLVLYGEMFLDDSTINADTEQVYRQKKAPFVASVEKQVDFPAEVAVSEFTEAVEQMARNRKKLQDEVPPVPKRPTSLVHPEGRKRYDLVQPALSALASLGLCFFGALIMHQFPEFLFDYISLRADPESAWPLSEYYCFIVFMVIFVLLIVLLPLLALASKSRWLGYGQDWRLTKCISLLLWCVFFGCLAPLNISTSFLLLLTIQPVLMIVYLCISRSSRLLAVLLLLLVCPPALLLLAFLLNPFITQFPPPTTQNVASLPTQLGKVLLQSYLEADLLGSWSWNIATRIVLPLWLFTWSGVLVSD
uniref:Glycosylphosphatidylinositol anchor attachment 1 protein n=2 Tax=Schistocephalus solidus TaxID=70667 RepID=A0A0X3PPB7_SCHSO